MRIIGYARVSDKEQVKSGYSIEAQQETIQQWCASRMEAKLKANDHKGGWHNEYAEYFLSRMTDEFEELVAALETGNTEKSISECADVANFAMMLADNIWRYGVISDRTLTSSAMEKLVKPEALHASAQQANGADAESKALLTGENS